MSVPQDLQGYFQQFQQHIIGEDQFFDAGYGPQPLIYADASGRLYQPIEELICKKIAPKFANTHSFSSETGKFTTYLYQFARKTIKEHVNAGSDDILVATGSGMTAALSKLQRLMGLKGFGLDKKRIPEKERPVVFISEMEHHSNHVSWMETIAEVVIVPAGSGALIDPEFLEKELQNYAERPMKIGAFTACSNVTGLITNYKELARIMHRHGGYCFIDFAASAPYVAIDMHPNDTDYLDAIFFSPHKFLGGPGSSGVLIFNRQLYKVSCPDNPGGGNVKWTSPDGRYSYVDDVEVKEDGGTPGILQVIRVCLAIQLKEKMGVENIQKREAALLSQCYRKLIKIPGIYILGNTSLPRIGCISFTIEGIHYNLMVRLLNDRFGIQVRGGWSCASTYAHSLFRITSEKSNKILEAIDGKDLTEKPGWVRLSLHPTLSDEKLDMICASIAEVQQNYETWKNDYAYNQGTNEFESIKNPDDYALEIQSVFEI